MLTNAHENYYAAYDGSMIALAAAINDGFSPVTTSRDDVPEVGETDPASAFVFCIQNHDQVGNRPFGDRLHHEIAAGRYAVASTILLFAPETPLLFMGQEFSASTPFLYFTDHPEELGKLVTEGRRNEFEGFGAFQHETLRETIPDPQGETTFLGSQLRLEERNRHTGIHRLYRDLLHRRREDPVQQHNDRARTQAIALGADLLAVHRWWQGQHRLLLANLGAARTIDLAEIADLPGLEWQLSLTTSDPEFDGSGDPVTIDRHAVSMPARTAVILAS
jgi:maltooligosyltrehalose trehalohydrolase